MTFFRRTVAGEGCLVVALPGFTPRALGEWQRFTSSDPAGIYGLDVETTAIGLLGAFDPRMQMRLIQFGTKTEAWVLPIAGPWRSHVEAFLRSAARFVSHNASFDTTRVLTEYDIDLGDRSIDTLPMAALRWPGITMSRDLKDQCDYYIDSGLSDAETALHARFVDDFFATKERKGRLLPLSFVPGESTCRKPKTKNAPKCLNVSDPISRVGYCTEHYLSRAMNKDAKEHGWNTVALDEPAFLIYAGLDAIYVRRLLDILADEIKHRGMAALSRTEQKVGRLMTGVSRRGHRVDAEWTKPLLDEIGREYDEYRDRVEEATGYVPGSTYLRDWLRRHDLVFEKLTKDTLPDLLLERPDPLDPVHGVLADLIEVSKRKNILTNLRIIWLHATEGDGFTHSNINTQQAHTGRMSVTGPAMQTFKKTDKRLRGCFIAREGHVLIGADYNSQEIRIAAALSRDPMYLKIVREGLNQHVLTAMSIHKETSGPMFARCSIGGCGECAECSAAKKMYPDEYHDIKILDFMQQYGGGPKKIGLQLGIPYGDARAMWQTWRQTYAGLVSWSEFVAKQAHVVNPFGRVIPRDPFREYANSNYLIQSSGRDVLGASLVELAENGWGDNIWLPVHDEIVMEVEEDRAEDGCAALTEHMTFQFGDIEIPAEGEIIGKRWGGLAA